MAKTSSFSKTAVWVLLALLILGLAGFGATNLNGNIRTIGKVGSKPISTQSYFSAMQREMRAFQEQTGQALPFAEARAIGLDQAVLQQLVTTRALDHEATQMGLSIGDENVRDQVLSFDAFKSLDGTFDREAYAFALERQGLSEEEFEDSLREDTARRLLQSAVINGISMPASFADTLVAYAGEQRSFTWSALDPTLVAGDVIEPTDAELQAYYDENTDQFMLPASKDITYAWLTPEMLVDQVELDEDALRQAYDDRIDEFAQPERRLVERLVFLDQDAADSAAAALEVDGTTFETLVEGRGLTLQDVDLGDVDRLELDAAGEAVFAAETGDVVGPLPTDLGPALFRVNGILPAQKVEYEEALPTLRETLALERAGRIIENQAENYEDLLAGGATLEEVAAESDMVLGQIDWTEESADDIAAYLAFRDAAAQLTLDDFPEIELLDDGGVFAMRLNREQPARPEPFDDAKDKVRDAMIVERTQAALSEMAEGLVAQIAQGADFAELNLTATVEEDRTRGAFVPNTPPAFLDEVFAMEPGDVRTVTGGGFVVIVRLDAVDPAADSDQATALRASLQRTLDQALAQDLFDIYTNDVGLRAEPRIDQAAVEAVNANFQ
ncbi:peptidylprolyl isomerase [Aliishimia ponticola]|uniref:Peptidylprolyl isomerase n=1 Tax=Aliishimia ponticola TaxID=2499833 RepID=A0A4S4NIW6_9RHOB|nr:peptidyl-prolyl cis-trans isomerase [Aliishimia ponticola]THH38845.1 peptidylprolyl isomerase [Aliishimia ponticola]